MKIPPAWHKIRRAVTTDIIFDQTIPHQQRPKPNDRTHRSPPQVGPQIRKVQRCIHGAGVPEVIKIQRACVHIVPTHRYTSPPVFVICGALLMAAISITSSAADTLDRVRLCHPEAHEMLSGIDDLFIDLNLLSETYSIDRTQRRQYRQYSVLFVLLHAVSCR